MKRFLFLTDTHFRADRPRNRVDDVLVTQKEELTEIAHLVHEHDVDAILHGGDLFDKPNPPHKLVTDLIEWCKFVERPIYSLIGNHDITGYNLESVRNSGLGVMFESGAVDRLDFETYEKDKIAIMGVHSTLQFQDKYMFSNDYDGYTKIILSHNYIIPSETMPFEFVHPRDISTNADLVLCGHYHVAFDYVSGQTRWVNPGSIARWSIDHKDRHPSVLLIEVKDGALKVQKIPLVTARPGESLFDLAQVSLESKREADIATFVESLEQTNFASVDIEQEIRRIGQDQGIGKEILDTVLSKIHEAKEILK